MSCRRKDAYVAPLAKALHETRIANEENNDSNGNDERRAYLENRNQAIPLQLGGWLVPRRRIS